MMRRESDLGDGDAVIQTLIWSSAFLETDGKGVGVEAETSQQNKFLDTQMTSNRWHSEMCGEGTLKSRGWKKKRKEKQGMTKV